MEFHSNALSGQNFSQEPQNLNTNETLLKDLTEKVANCDEDPSFGTILRLNKLLQENQELLQTVCRTPNEFNKALDKALTITPKNNAAQTKFNQLSATIDRIRDSTIASSSSSSNAPSSNEPSKIVAEYNEFKE